MIRTLFFVGIGSFAGGVFRYLLSRLIQDNTMSSFPFATFIVNLAGCFAIGLFYGLFERTNFLSQDLKLFLTVGLCGGFTTFSTFINENVSLLKDGSFFYFLLYTGLSIFLGIIAVYLGNLTIKIF
jgi:crcB protein